MSNALSTIQADDVALLAAGKGDEGPEEGSLRRPGQGRKSPVPVPSGGVLASPEMPEGALHTAPPVVTTTLETDNRSNPTTVGRGVDSDVGPDVGFQDTLQNAKQSHNKKC